MKRDRLRQRGEVDLADRRPAADAASPGRHSGTRMSDDRSAIRPCCTATGIAKTFDRTRALAGAHLELRAGRGARPARRQRRRQIDAVQGHHRPRHPATRARSVYRGQPLRLRSTRDALRAGIAIVMQETSLAPDMSVLENIFLPELGRPGGCLFCRLRQRGAGDLLATPRPRTRPAARHRRCGASPPRSASLSRSPRRSALDADLIIFDEPTASLSPTEVDRLFDIMARLRDDGPG